jgi:hypothetical protein
MKLASTWRISAVDDSHDSTAWAGAPKLLVSQGRPEVLRGLT